MALTGDSTFLSDEQMTRLQEEISYVMENEGSVHVDGQRNVVDDALFGEEEDRDIEMNSTATADMGGVGGDEICGTSAEAGGVLFEYLKSLIEKIKKEIAEKKQPFVYQSGSFWHRPRDPIFALEALWITSTGINP
jgi:hypothetical protein